jgi:hypothetical protein
MYFFFQLIDFNNNNNNNNNNNKKKIEYIKSRKFLTEEEAVDILL